jgi:hypothetical protein
LAENQKLSCVYLVKELIAQDTDNEWVITPEFGESFNDFVTKINTDLLAMQTLVMKLKALYTSKVGSPYLSSPQDLAFDLTRSFAQAIVDITPRNFRLSTLSDKNQSLAFVRLNELTVKLTQRVCLDILEAKNLEESSALFEFYMEVMAELLKKPKNGGLVYNVGAAFAIFNGLQMGAVTRLKT